MTIPPIKRKHVVGTKHFVTGIIEDFLHSANLKHFLDMNLFKSAKKLSFADKEGKGSMAHFVAIGIDVFPDIWVVFRILGECLRMEMLGDVTLRGNVEDEQTRWL